MIRETDQGLFCGSAVAGTMINGTEIMSGTAWKRIDVGPSHRCAITDGNELYCWGDNENGQLGNGSQQLSETPVLVSTGNMNWKQVAVAEQRSCGIQLDGTIYCWGLVERCNGGPSPTPMRLDPTDTRQYGDIELGPDHGCALDEDGVLVCFGDNERGQLGQGDTEASNCPVEVAGTWTALSVGNQASCGIQAGEASELYCWGKNTSSAMNLTPTPYSGSWSQVSVGANHRCALGDDEPANLFCWGTNTDGQLGVTEPGNTTDQPLPQPVLYPVPWKSVSAGENMTCAVAGGEATNEVGHVFCWGGTQEAIVPAVRLCAAE